MTISPTLADLIADPGELDVSCLGARHTPTMLVAALLPAAPCGTRLSRLELYQIISDLIISSSGWRGAPALELAGPLRVTFPAHRNRAVTAPRRHQPRPSKSQRARALRLPVPHRLLCTGSVWA